MNDVSSGEAELAVAGPPHDDAVPRDDEQAAAEASWLPHPLPPVGERVGVARAWTGRTLEKATRPTVAAAANM